MARLTNTIVGPNVGLGNFVNAPIIDPTFGGTHGWSVDYDQYLSNQAYVSRNIFCLLLEAPRFFSLMPNPSWWVQMLKSIMEDGTRVIEGLNGGLKVDVEEHPIGGAGEMQQEVTNVTRERTEPSVTFDERAGAPIQFFMEQWIRYGLMDPEVKLALAATLNGTQPTDLLPDWYSMSCVFIQPDPTGLYAFRTWLVANMFPLGTGEIVGKKDKTTTLEQLTLQIPFSGFAQFNLGTNVLGQKLMSAINLVNANPYFRPAFVQNISADVSAATVAGYQEGIANLSATGIAGR